MTVQPIPEGFPRVTPYLVVDGAAECLDFIRDVFGAEERLRLDGRNGTVGHAETAIGDSVLMVADGSEENATQPAMLHVYVEDCDATFERALAAGATALREPVDEFYGDRRADVRDRFGNHWSLATHVEDVPEEEMARRARERMA
jgi:PhnB protein